MTGPDPLERLERGVSRLAPLVAQQAWETGNRLGLLWVHSFVGLVAGVLILVNGTATTLVPILPAAKLLTGLPGIAGGALLAVGLLARPRRVLVEVAGLVVLAAWDLLMAVGFVIAVTTQSLHARWYPIVIYVGYLALIVVHLWTLRQLYHFKQRRRQEARR